MSSISDPTYAEDSTIKKLAPSLQGILRDLEENATHHDYLVALLIVFLAECGFRVSTTDDNGDLQRINLNSLRIPENWKSQQAKVYDIRFQFVATPTVICRLVAIPSGDTLIINCDPLVDRRKTYTMCVQTLKYVNPFSSDLCGRYRNLKEISHRFKETVVLPLRIDVATREGVAVPSLQNLPLELTEIIMRSLCPYERNNLKKILQIA
ncbi:uncharacterized protein LOC143359617 [Halictus rubicundus]|uniref:uncharacterized protein LOC143359617 n=1 Tax=Halictus rubicundus TaxID=77578 RepID=UPI004036D6A4